MQQWQGAFPAMAADPALIYLDSAATCQVPGDVIDAMQNYLIHQHANVHRASYARAAGATQCYEAARQKVAEFINTGAENLSLQPSSTIALNLLTKMAIDWQPGDEILISAAEHHANLIPWQMLAQAHQLKLVVAPVCQQTGECLGLEDYFSNRTRLLALTMASNVTGVVNDVARYCHLARQRGIISVIDAAQAAAHIEIDVGKLDCDALVFSAHKVYGPTGIAALYLSDTALSLASPLYFGGGAVVEVTDVHTQLLSGVQKLEAGTPNVMAAVGFAAALEWLVTARADGARAFLQQLHGELLAQLQQRHWLKILPCSTSGAPLISVFSEQVHSHDLALLLGEQNVAVRAGHHCAQPLLTHWQLDGVVRFSLGLTVTAAQIKRTLSALDQAYAILSES